MISDVPAGAGNLPAELNSFIGRERDLAELARLVDDVRVLTLCGPGGIGKTRLALRLAAQLAPRFPDGAWLAELADTTDPGQLAPRVAAVLGIRPERGRQLADTLADALRPRRLLLILDTCEHLVEACATLVLRLLTSCPQLRVITTSREPLRLRGETAWRVPPLQLPSGDDEIRGAITAALSQLESVRLFTARAAAAWPGFRLGPGNLAAVIRICQALDGMPLAIELAAARVRALSVAQIATRLDDRFPLLAAGNRTAPPRQQTLRAAVDWSYQLLTEPEQVLLRRLSVFAGWNLEMAEAVCADAAMPAGQVLALLAALIDKSLVTVDGESAGVTRYRLLDTIRDYAAGQLAVSGEGAELRRRHRDYLLDLVETVLAQAFVRGDPAWPQRAALYHLVARERANYELALSECERRGDAAEGLRICCALRAPWVVYGDAADGAAWFDRLLALADGAPADDVAADDVAADDVAADGGPAADVPAADVPAADVPAASVPAASVPAALRGRSLMMRAELAFEQRDYPAAARFAQAGLDASRQAGDGRGAGAQRILALASLQAAEPDAALAQARAAVATAQAAGDVWEEGLALAAVGAIEGARHRTEAAQESFEQALGVLAGNNGWGIAQVRYGLGVLARAHGGNAAALGHFQAALALYRAIDARPEMARCLAAIGRVALAQGDLTAAGTSIAESLRLSCATGHRLAVARGLETLAALTAARGDPAGAVRIEGAALALREAATGRLSGRASRRLEALLGRVHGRLDEATTAGLLAEGRALSPDEVVRLALSRAAAEPPPGRPAAGERPARGLAAGGQAPDPGLQSAPPPPDGGTAPLGGAGQIGARGGPDAGRPGGPAGASHQNGAGSHQNGTSRPRGARGGPDAASRNGEHPGAAALDPLTPREQQIAGLLAAGLTNREIAAELVISPATAARHVANIFGKLGFNSRAKVAVWVADQEAAARSSPAGPQARADGPH
ncbi:MAG: LuxR C-terminal-related transcriptional regulator [Streptosporangiaceae bacterium]